MAYPVIWKARDGPLTSRDGSPCDLAQSLTRAGNVVSTCISSTSHLPIRQTGAPLPLPPCGRNSLFSKP